MINIVDNHNCCGCEACVQICPRRCISFREDDEGFSYPIVDKSACVFCGRCEKACPVLNQANKHEPLGIYAAKNVNENDLLSSSSGGLFISLANKTICDGGVVFGAKFNSDWDVVHDYTETQEGIRAFMGSKYVQSRIGNAYNKAKEFLEASRPVLFSGTSCQIAGLKTFLGKDYPNLLTVDVICHGVPSSKIWHKYLNELISERETLLKSNITVESISFRDKRFGWDNYCFALTHTCFLADGQKRTVSFSHIYKKNPYMRLFLSNMILRPSCYRCPAKGGKSQSDLTIADFWGIDCSHPELYDKRGVGLLFINTLKGKHALDVRSLTMTEVSLEDAIAKNPCYMHSVIEPSKRERCFILLNKKKTHLSDVVEKIFRVSIYLRIKRKAKHYISKIIH